MADSFRWVLRKPYQIAWAKNEPSEHKNNAGAQISYVICPTPLV